MDGRVDPGRIAHVTKVSGDPDVACFQEVADNYDSLAGSAGENQPQILAGLFPGYSAHFACAVDVPDAGVKTRGGRRRFGNLILSRLPVRQVLRHSLPWQPEAEVPSMPRVALEAVVEAPWGPVSVVTTHLEYYSARQRAAQVERLCELQAQRAGHAAAKPAYKSGPFEPFDRPAASILTGDFNMPPGDPLVARLRAEWTDVWLVAHPGVAHPASFGVYDPQFASKPYCCDFVFVTQDLAPRIAAVRIDQETQASDHQPVIVEIR